MSSNNNNSAFQKRVPIGEENFDKQEYREYIRKFFFIKNKTLLNLLTFWKRKSFYKSVWRGIKIFLTSFIGLLYYFILYVFFMSFNRAKHKRNPYQITLVRNFFTYGIIIIFFLILFFYYFIELLINYLTNSPIFISPSMLFTPDLLFRQMESIYSYLLFVSFIAFALINYILFLTTSQNFGMLILGEEFVNKSGTPVFFWKKNFYSLFILFLSLTFFLWPLFLSIWCIIFSINAIYRINILHKLFRLRIVYKSNSLAKNLTNEKYLVPRYSNIVTTNQFKHTFQWRRIILDNSSVIVNIFIYLFGFNAIFAFSKIYKIIFNKITVTIIKHHSFSLNIFIGYLLAFFTGIKTKTISIFTLENVRSNLFYFVDSNDSITQSFIGSTGIINVHIDSQQFNLSWTSKITSWASFWNDLYFVVSLFAINLYYNTYTMITWIIILFLAFWFILNFIFMLFYGATLLRFIMNGRDSVLTNCATEKKLILPERIYYCIAYLIWILLFFLPIVNIFWILLNIFSLFKTNKSLLNVLTDTYYTKNNFKKDEKQQAIKDSVNVLNKLYKSLRIDVEEYESTI